jgi:hypothetical protein
MTRVSRAMHVMKPTYWYRNEGTKVQPVKGNMAGRKVDVIMPYGMMTVKFERLSMHSVVMAIVTLCECFHIARTRSVIATIRNVSEFYYLM